MRLSTNRTLLNARTCQMKRKARQKRVIKSSSVAATGALIGLVGGGNCTNIAQAAGVGGASRLYSGNGEKRDHH